MGLWFPAGGRIRYWSSQTIKTDLNGNIWIGTFSNQMLIIDPLGNLSEHLDVNSGLLSNDVWGIVEDKNGLIWMATYNGLNIYDPSKNKMMALNVDNGLHDIRVHRMSLLDEEHILAGGNGGFSIIDLKNSTLTGYKMDPGISRGFRKSLMDQDGDIWIGSSNGILVFNPENGTMKRLVQNSGGATDLIRMLQIDDDANIWAGTDNGLFVINPRDNTIFPLGENDGLFF